MTTYPFYPKNKAEGGERRQQKREEYGENKIISFFFFFKNPGPSLAGLGT